MNKERFTGIIIGFILFAVLSASVMAAASTQTVTKQITYGVNINLNGRLMQLAEDSQPFIMDGRTFLPLRAIAEAVDLSVDFDAASIWGINLRRAASYNSPGSTGACSI